ncbi:DNA-directed RNA polymerases I and III subunit RPAC1 [Microplitis mediator]|uniref:DNA-directed RNA polymerases I and III subunit RPAC1 n=1 Tax=Microplitis mediator TaxID=375433 RepID=UPI002552135B|nr:DNA-directed RNA polymerases I and III subunit RPAC1 [Microplitis mediator]
MDKKTQSPRVTLEEYGIPNVSEFSNLQFTKWSLENFRKNFKINIVRQSDDKRELEFDLIGCTAALANSFRRILLSEVPSMAIDKVYMLNNTSLIQDEVLAHRLGLLPLRADPKLFEFPATSGTTSAEEEEVSDQDTLRYELKIICTRNQNAPKDSRLNSDMYRNSEVYSSDIKWVPIGRQADMYPDGEKQFGMLEPDILIAKLIPGHEIHAYMHAVKGIGKDHAKFSPVATACYRLMPVIQLRKPITGQDAELLKTCFSPGVIELVKNKKKGEVEARVKDARYDSCSRNVFRHDVFKNSVRLERIPDHFIFNIESIGAMPPGHLFLEAVKVLKGKCRTFLEELDSIH